MADIGPETDARHETLADIRQRLISHWHIPALVLSMAAFVAAAVFALLPREEPPQPAEILSQAEAALKNQRYILADHLAEEYLRQFPVTDPLVHRIQGSSAYYLAMAATDEKERRKWLEKSRAAYAAALPLEKRRVPIETVERMGRIALALEEYAEAITHLESAIAYDPPQLVELELLRIGALEKLQPDDTDVLLQELARVTAEANKRLSATQRDLASASGESESTVRRIAGRVVELKADLARLVVVEAAVLGRRDEYAKAEQRLREVLGLCDEGESPSREVLLSLAEAQGGQGKWTEALDTLNAVLDMSAGLASESADARAHLMKGRALYSQMNYDRAVEQFKLTAKLFPEAVEGLAARLGLAETFLALEDTARAQEVLAEVLPHVRQEGQKSDLIDLTAVRQMLRSQSEMNLIRGRPQDALEFVLLEETILPEPQRDVLMRKAALLEQVAQRHAALAEQAEPGSDEFTAMRLAAELKWRQAGDIYSEVAETFDATTQYDYGHSRWAATRAYMKAGAHARTAEMLKQFIMEQPLDSRVPQARLDLAREYEVLGQWEKAVETYRELIAENPNTLPGFEGRFRLAVALIGGGSAHYDEAEEQLLSLVERSDKVLPESIWYRRSLFELGRLMHLRGRHNETLMRLSEFVRRYPDDEQSLSARFLMVRSIRQQGLAALERSRTAEQVIERRAAAEISRQKLSSAVAEMRQLVGIYDELPSEARTPLALNEQRSLLFDLADTLLQLSRTDEAIAAYDEIVSRYQTSPAAMSAYSRLASEYRKLNKRDQLMAVLERARWTLEKIPEEAFAAEPGMSRAFWQYWLETMQL